MECFERLVQSNFLANVHMELELAQKTLRQDHQAMQGSKSYSGDKKTGRLVYNKCVEQFELTKPMEESLSGNTQQLFYLQIDYLIFAFSSKRAQIDDAIRHSYNLSGDLPFFRGRHKVGGVTFHTVLIDTRFSFKPISPN